jgi:hypothetical protein
MSHDSIFAGVLFVCGAGHRQSPVRAKGQPISEHSSLDDVITSNHVHLIIPKLFWLLQTDYLEEFRRHFVAALEERIRKDDLKLEAQWTGALAVGSRQFIDDIEAGMRSRRVTQVEEGTVGWVLREE